MTRVISSASINGEGEGQNGSVEATQMWVYDNPKMAKRPAPQTDFNQNAMSGNGFLPQYVVTPYVVSSTASSVATQPNSVDYVNSLPAMQGMPAAVAPPSESHAIRSSYGAAQLHVKPAVVHPDGSITSATPGPPYEATTSKGTPVNAVARSAAVIDASTSRTPITARSVPVPITVPAPVSAPAAHTRSPAPVKSSAAVATAPLAPPRPMLQVPRPPLAHQPSLAVQPASASEAAAINATLTELKPVQGMFNQAYIPAYGQYNNTGGEYQAYPQYAHTPQYAYVTDPNWPARYAAPYNYYAHSNAPNAEPPSGAAAPPQTAATTAPSGATGASRGPAPTTSS
ncbi:hypothetical protein LSAT2_004508 [Lamellibrachia satsuma]|nr:hypothetical protein LSAT2_004508 [Lamellibrachia satsuma]